MNFPGPITGCTKVLSFQVPIITGLTDSASLPKPISPVRANPDLTFEKMKNVNIGLEGCFFNQSLWLDANVFYTRNSGQVVRRGIYAPYVGNLYPYENYETMDYKGAELGLNWTEQIGQFSFDLGANVLLSNSKAIKHR
ncbi:MAG: TonB-dependent receptor domain-containing protein [Mangrovibacterium sp.]